MKDLRTIILAAGKGTRMKSELPKVLHKVCGKSLIDYVLDVVKSVGSLKIYVVLGHRIDEVKKYLPKNLVVLEQTELLGTADAVKRAQKDLKNFKGHVLVLCGDTPLLRTDTVQKIVDRHFETKAVCTVLTATVNNPDGYGRIIRRNGQAIAIREDKDCSLQEKQINEINVGVYCFSAPELLKALDEVKVNALKKEFYLTDVVEGFSKNNLKVETVQTPSALEGLGVNTREDLAVAQKEIQQKILSQLMLSGVTIVDPKTTFIDVSVKIGEDTIIRPFTFIEENVVIGKNCVIGPFARIRPGCVLEDEVEIGNFTEVSRTKIGNKTRMKHFGFLGDAQIGKDVNIGAGTVTANYDGKSKNKTVIGDQAFIGSDSILVAPVKIGKKAMTGAGSVVTKGMDIPDGKVAVGVPAKLRSRSKK